MKKLIYYLTLSACLFNFTSCSDFLEEHPSSEFARDQFFKNRDDAFASINILYRKGRLGLMNPSPYLGSQYLYMTGYRSGLIDNPVGRGNNECISHFQTLSINPISDNNDIVSSWSAPYEAIVRNANYALENLPTCPGLTDVERKQLIGEASFFRAFNYFYLVQTWGPIPIILNSYQSVNDIYVQRSSEKLVYEQILKDLKVALDAGLPDKPMPENNFRVSRGSVLALAADVCLCMAGYPVNDVSKYAEAYTYAKELINNPNYALIQNGGDISDSKNWNKSAFNTIRTSDNEKEYLYVFEYDATITPGGNKPTWCLPFEAGAWGFKYDLYMNCWQPTEALLAAYDPDDDLRYQEHQWFHSSYTTSDGVKHEFQNRLPYFWWEEKALLQTAISEKDYNLYRLSEMYLIAAEALMQLDESKQDEAAGYLATIKARASIHKDYATIKKELLALSKEDFLNEVLREKIRETMFEFKIWGDVLRTQKYPILDASGHFTFVPLVGTTNPFGAVFTVDNLYIPYPDQVIQRNPLMKEEILQ